MAGYLGPTGGSGLMLWNSHRLDSVCADHGSAIVPRSLRCVRMKLVRGLGYSNVGLLKVGQKFLNVLKGH